MPVLSTPAPYDSLAVVTQLTRTYLADYIANIQPNLAGVLNTNGMAVTWVSGTQFSYLLNGQALYINNVAYVVQQVTSATTGILQTTAGVQNGVAFTATLPTGDIFADSQAYVLPTVNAAWRKVQKKLADKGHPRLRNEVDLFSIPIITNLDPVSQQFISWTQFFDGTNFQNSQSVPPAPLLPQDFISPLRIWERQSGMTIHFRPMHPIGDGLKSRVKTSYNRWWDWREDAIYFPGSLLNMDLRIAYCAFLTDLVVIDGSFSLTPVPIMRCADALAYYSAGIFVMPRGGEALAPGYFAQGDMAVDQITNSWAKLQQRSSFHRRAWGERGRQGYRYGS
jgi:hypothetical protein